MKSNQASTRTCLIVHELMMKMIMAVIQTDDVVTISDALVTAGYRVTRLATTGGWLRRENTTLLIGVEDRQANHVLRVIQHTCHRRTVHINLPATMPGSHESETLGVEVGGATVFVFDVERYEHY